MTESQWVLLGIAWLCVTAGVSLYMLWRASGGIQGVRKADSDLYELVNRLRAQQEEIAEHLKRIEKLDQLCTQMQALQDAGIEMKHWAASTLAKLSEIEASSRSVAERVERTAAEDLRNASVRIDAKIRQRFDDLKTDILALEKRLQSPVLRGEDPPEHQPRSGLTAAETSSFRMPRVTGRVSSELAAMNDKLLPHVAKLLAGRQDALSQDLLSLINAFFGEVDACLANEQSGDTRGAQACFLRFVDAMDDLLRTAESSSWLDAFRKALDAYLEQLMAIFGLREINVDIGKEAATGERHQIVGTETSTDPSVPSRTIVAVRRRGFKNREGAVVRKPHVVDCLNTTKS